MLLQKTRTWSFFSGSPRSTSLTMVRQIIASVRNWSVIKMPMNWSVCSFGDCISELERIQTIPRDTHWSWREESLTALKQETTTQKTAITVASLWWRRCVIRRRTSAKEKGEEKGAIQICSVYWGQWWGICIPGEGEGSARKGFVSRLCQHRKSTSNNEGYWDKKASQKGWWKKTSKIEKTKEGERSPTSGDSDHRARANDVESDGLGSDAEIIEPTAPAAPRPRPQPRPLTQRHPSSPPLSSSPRPVLPRPVWFRET